MKIEEMIVGEIYAKEGESEIYKCVDIANDWACVICYSFNHYVATCMFWTQEYLDEDYNKDMHEVQGCDAEYYKDLFKTDLLFRDETTLHLRSDF